MGFYFRKSIRLGGFRVNLSKSGIGYSYGVKGFRISTGPRGTYATVGRNGFYYRERIDGPRSRTAESSATLSQDRPIRQNASTIETADVSQLVDSSSERVLSQINERRSKTAILPATLAILGVLSLILISSQASFLLFGLISIFGLVLSVAAHRADYQRRTTSLTYELEGEIAKRRNEIFTAPRARVL
jgi:hypothetical protein